MSTKKKIEGQKPVEESPILPMIETEPEKPVENKKLSDTVKVKVLIGTLQWEEGVFSKGDTFMVSRERVKLFNPTNIEILE